MDEEYKRVTVPLTIVDNGQGAGYLRLMWPDGQYVKVYEDYGAGGSELYDAMRATLDAAPAPEAPQAPPRPTIGRIVHVVTADGTEHPAIVVGVVETEVGSKCDLAAFVAVPFPPQVTVEYFVRVRQSDGPMVGRWHWPEREGA